MRCSAASAPLAASQLAQQAQAQDRACHVATAAPSAMPHHAAMRPRRLQAVAAGHAAISSMCKALTEWAALVGKPKRRERVLPPPGLHDALVALAAQQVEDAYRCACVHEAAAVAGAAAAAAAHRHLSAISVAWLHLRREAQSVHVHSDAHSMPNPQHVERLPHAGRLWARRSATPWWRQLSGRRTGSCAARSRTPAPSLDWTTSR